MRSDQATLAMLERAAILLEKRDARRRQWQQLYAAGKLLVPPVVRLAYAADGRVFVAWRRFGAKEINAATVNDLRNFGTLRDDRGILDAFVRLADEERPEPFLAFARRYGPLELCAEHELPLLHPVYLPETGPEYTACQSWLLTDNNGNDSEYNDIYDGVPVDVCRRYAVEIKAALIAAASLHQNQPIPESAWEIFVRALWRVRIGKTPPTKIPWRGNVAAERERLGLLIDAWIARAQLRPTYEWTDAYPYIGLGGADTYGAIIRQLAFAVAQVRGVAVCAGCGQPFVPYRRWKYCRSCGKRAADREAQRRRRARLAAER